MTKKEYNADNIKQPKQKLSQTIEKLTFDKKTGEQQSGEKTNVFNGKEKEPPFLKMYLEDIEILHRLPKNSSDVLHELLRNMNYQSEITVNSLMKNRIAEKLNIKNVRSINNYLSSMVEKDVLQRIGRGVYIVNPYLIAKGEWADIKGLRVEYKENGKRVVTPDEEDFEEVKEG